MFNFIINKLFKINIFCYYIFFSFKGMYKGTAPTGLMQGSRNCIRFVTYIEAKE